MRVGAPLLESVRYRLPDGVQIGSVFSDAWPRAGMWLVFSAWADIIRTDCQASWPTSNSHQEPHEAGVLLRQEP